MKYYCIRIKKEVNKEECNKLQEQNGCKYLKVAPEKLSEELQSLKKNNYYQSLKAYTICYKE